MEALRGKRCCRFEATAVVGVDCFPPPPEHPATTSGSSNFVVLVFIDATTGGVLDSQGNTAG